MEQRKLRAAIVGASTLLGKEVAEQLAEDSLFAWDLTLLDDEDAAGQMTAAGEEAMVIQPLGPGAFSDMDVVFFASDEADAKTHANEALQAGGAVIDLTGALASGDVPVMSPWVEGARAADLTTAAVVPAQAAALMLALVATKLRARFGTVKMIATVLQPASQHGKAGLDELHAQTAALLTFQAIPRQMYDAQVAFNLQTVLGEDAKVQLAREATRIRAQFTALTGDAPLTFQLVQAPVFHGYTASIYVEVSGVVTVSDLREALHGGAVEVTSEDDLAPSNLSATEQAAVLVSLADDGAGDLDGVGHWLWIAADNLRLTARNAVACAVELAKLRPAGKVQ